MVSSTALSGSINPYIMKSSIRREIGDWRSEIGDPARVSEDRQGSLEIAAEV
jgi:hypothetical protein